VTTIVFPVLLDRLLSTFRVATAPPGAHRPASQFRG
jgi:hypothetical protein